MSAERNCGEKPEERQPRETAEKKGMACEQRLARPTAMNTTGNAQKSELCEKKRAAFSLQLNASELEPKA